VGERKGLTEGKRKKCHYEMEVMTNLANAPKGEGDICPGGRKKKGGGGRVVTKLWAQNGGGGF